MSKGIHWLGKQWLRNGVMETFHWRIKGFLIYLAYEENMRFFQDSY